MTRPARLLVGFETASAGILHCADDASWPAADLFWSEAENGWVCSNCWDERDIDEDAGISLERELAR